MPTPTLRTWITTLSGQSDQALTISTPLEGALVNSTTILVAWAFAALQEQYRVQFFSDALGQTIIYDSQWTVGSGQSQSFDLSLAGLISNTTYYVRVAAHGTNAEDGESSIVSFLFALPTSVNITNLQAAPLPICNPTPFDNPAIRVSWTRPVPTETFLAYEVRRRKRGETVWVPIARILGANTPYYLDSNVQPGQEYEYVVVFYGDNATPTTKLSAQQSTPARATVNFDFTYLHEVASGQTEYARINAFGGNVEPKIDVALSATWGRLRPTAFFGENFAHSISIPGLDLLRKHPAEWAKFERLLSRQATAASTLCLRYGLDRELYFVALVQLAKSHQERSYTPTFQLQEVEYSEDIGLYVHTPGGSP